MRHARSAGLVVIGDEVLKGKCQDLNTAFATQKLWEKVGGVSVGMTSRILVTPAFSAVLVWMNPKDLVWTCLPWAQAFPVSQRLNSKKGCA